MASEPSIKIPHTAAAKPTEQEKKPFSGGGTARGSSRESLACHFKSTSLDLWMTKTIKLDLFPSGARETHSPYCQEITDAASMSANPRQQNWPCCLSGSDDIYSSLSIRAT